MAQVHDEHGLLKNIQSCEITSTRLPRATMNVHAQIYFSGTDGYIDGKKVYFHYFFDVPHPDGCIVKAYRHHELGNLQRPDTDRSHPTKWHFFDANKFVLRHKQ